MTVNQNNQLANRFEEHRSQLRAVAYRMLGSLAEAEDAVQEAWLRLSNADSDGIRNLGGWLTTVVARIALDTLRSRKSRREDALDVFVPDPIVSHENGIDPEHEALLADSIGLALLVVLESLEPAERLAFVLHDVFGVPFDEIAPIVDRTPVATRKLASRARQRVRAASPDVEPDVDRQREVVDAFLEASRGQDFDALLSVLDPDVVLRLDFGEAPGRESREVRGSSAVVDLGFRFSAGPAWVVHPALVNGAVGLVVTRRERAFSVIGFTVSAGKIVAIDILADPARLTRLDLSGFSG